MCISLYVYPPSVLCECGQERECGRPQEGALRTDPDQGGHGEEGREGGKEGEKDRERGEEEVSYYLDTCSFRW